MSVLEQPETVSLVGLTVPVSLQEALEQWARNTENAVGDVLRSILSVGLTAYLRKRPQLAPLLTAPINDLAQMTPEVWISEAYCVKEGESGEPVCQPAPADQHRLGRVSVSVHPQLLALMRSLASRDDWGVSEMLVEGWCVNVLDFARELHDMCLLRRLLSAWTEHGVREDLRPALQEIANTAFGARGAPVQ